MHRVLFSIDSIGLYYLEFGRKKKCKKTKNNDIPLGWISEALLYVGFISHRMFCKLTKYTGCQACTSCSTYASGISDMSTLVKEPSAMKLWFNGYHCMVVVTLCLLSGSCCMNVARCCVHIHFATTASCPYHFCFHRFIPPGWVLISSRVGLPICINKNVLSFVTIHISPCLKIAKVPYHLLCSGCIHSTYALSHSFVDPLVILCCTSQAILFQLSSQLCTVIMLPKRDPMTIGID